MPLRIEIQDNLYCPGFICEQCGEPIDGPGNFEWRIGDKGKPVDGMIYFTHKHCTRAFRDERGGQSGWACDELDCLPVYLLASLGIDTMSAIAKARQRAKRKV